MTTKELRRYLQQNPSMIRWLAANENWLSSNPQALETMLKNPSFLSTYSQFLQQRRSQILRRTQLIEAQQAPNTMGGAPQRSRFNLPSLADLNEKIHHTSQFIDGIRRMMGIMGIIK